MPFGQHGPAESARRRRTRPSAFLHARAILVVTDPNLDIEPHAAFLQQAYRLTPAETRLARGLDLREVGEIH